MCGDVPRGGETCREFGVGTSVTLGLKIADVGENNLRRVRRGHGELGMRTQGIRNEELGIRNFLGTDEHGFKKTRLAARWVKALFALRLY